MFYLHIVKGAATVTLQVHVGEGEIHCLSCWETDHVDALAVVSVVVGPVGRDDDSFALCECATTSRIT